MASSHQVEGPITVQADFGAGFVELGFGSNDDRATYEQTVFGEELFSDEGGDAPEEIVHNSGMGLLTLTLRKWDPAQIAALLKTPGGASAEGKVGTVGRQWIASSDDFKIKLLSSKSGATSRTYNRCYLQGPNAVREFNIGNSGTLIGLSITCLPDASGVIYVKSTVA